MKKWNMLFLALLLLAMPVSAGAQDLPELFSGAYESIGQGLRQGAQLAAAVQDLTLDMHMDTARLEEGKTAMLTVTAGNPLPQEQKVAFTLRLPQRLKASDALTWEAVLPAAGQNPETGELVPSQTAFTRALALVPGGASEQAALECEMAMGTRFYRAGAALSLCVPDVSVSAHLDGVQDGRLQPGDAFVYRVALCNKGDAPKDVALEMVLPQAVTLAQPLAEGAVLAGDMLRAVMHVPAAQHTAQGVTEANVELALPAVVDADALADDADAQRLIAATLRADGEPVATPRLMVCGPNVTARLMAGEESLDAGAETTLSVVMVNSGLCAADVTLTCVLPEGLKALAAKEATAGEADEAVVPMTQDQPGEGETVPVQAQHVPEDSRQARTLVYDLHLPAAESTADGVIAHTKVVEIPVRAVTKQGAQQLLGASLAWRVNDEPTQLGEAVALRVRSSETLGLTRQEWNAVFWSGLLLAAVIICLSAAVRRDKKEEDYCFD